MHVGWVAEMIRRNICGLACLHLDNNIFFLNLMVKYSVILPTYQEKENLPIIIYLIMTMAQEKYLVFQPLISKYDFEVVIIEDNSPDGTYEVALQLQQHFGKDKIVIHKRPGKMGLGSAYIDGINFCTGDFVVIMDADLSHHPKYLPTFIERQKASGCDIVTGTRYKPGGGVFGWDFGRKLTSRVANFIAKSTLGSSYSDLTGSFRLYKKEVLAKVIKDVVSRGYAFQMEIIIRAQDYGYTVEEVPIVFVDRLFGESKLGPNEVLIYLRGVWNLMWAF